MMKRWSVIPSLLLVVASTASAAGPIGVHLGLNFADVSISPDRSTDTNTGFVVGVHYDAQLHPNFVLQPGFQFAQRGYGLTVGGSSFDATYNFMEIPVLLKAMLPQSGWAPFLAFGPNFGIKVGTDCSTSGGGTCTVTNANSTNFGMDLGFGADIEAGAGMLSPQLRFHFGINDQNTQPGPELHHRGIMLLVGYNF